MTLPLTIRGVRMPVSDPFESVLDAARSGAEWAWSRLVGDIDARLRGYVRRQG